ncbi:helix-turn-helix domain-containing protein [Pseudohoeflea coraliihabitans]|uniref:AraC family transcriptional regulator n=1 Tax=Pseudohoeflea coraliihabitans TaxID=2860393 RepID=A0ABS6WKB7_9HYPH|nr:AraC family transcriptional regulator [Pseudohoeflea sp. DP4N28-3]MBW3096379.1 AraC family transcriptional regulator [Pseudohoeflea sp. DP4N28-3]
MDAALSPAPISLVALTDLMFRGGTVAILLLLIIHLTRLPRSPVTIAGLLFCGTGIIEAMINIPASTVAMELPAWLAALLQQFHFVALWWFALALFDDHYRWRVATLWPLAVVLPLVAGFALGGERIGAAFGGALALFDAALLVLLIRLALTDSASDLVPARRTFRRALSFTVPPFTLLVIVLELVDIGGAAAELLCAGYAAVFFLLAVGFGFWLTSIKHAMVLRPTGTARTPADAELAAADRLELESVVAAMESGLYLEPGLTIGGLGERLEIPEHRLRRLINKGLGYRNFSAFVNDYRINEAKRRLADPQEAREQIVQHAFRLGYASLAPFNRAFRERVGISPREFREQALARGPLAAE